MYRLTAGLVLLLVACPGDDGSEPGDTEGVEPLFPADYAADYVEVRNCRGSGDHDLHNIRILVDPGAAATYQDRTEPFAEGAIVLKEEYDFGDLACSGPILQWTVMQKLAMGSSPETLDWQWQRIDPDRHVTGRDDDRCISCHTGCGSPPDGFDGTCAMP